MLLETTENLCASQQQEKKNSELGRMTKHLMTDSAEDSEFRCCFPSTSMFKGIQQGSGVNKTHWFP